MVVQIPDTRNFIPETSWLVWLGADVKQEIPDRTYQSGWVGEAGWWLGIHWRSTEQPTFITRLSLLLTVIIISSSLDGQFCLQTRKDFLGMHTLPDWLAQHLIFICGDLRIRRFLFPIYGGLLMLKFNAEKSYTFVCAFKDYLVLEIGGTANLIEH